MRDTLARLQIENKELYSLVESMRVTIAQLQHENKLLQTHKQFLMNRLFGRSSEKIDSRQMELSLGMAAAAAATTPTNPPPAPAHRARRKRTPRLPADLPTEEIIIEPDAVKQTPALYRLIGEEITQELDYIPPSYFRRLFIRRKYISLANRSLPPVIGALPPRLIPGGYAGVGLLTDIVLKKYVDHLPLYRQERILRTRHGITLSRKTMCDWMRVVGDWLKPIYNRVRDDLRKGGYLQVDETPVRYCMAEGGGSRQGYLWVYHRPGAGVLYEWHTGRGADCLKPMLDDFAGTIQCDGYGAYDCYARTRNQREAEAGRPQAIHLSGCWAHARRKFFEARGEAPGVGAWLLRQIAHLYGIEAQLRACGAGPRLRQAVRRAQSGMILARIHRALVRKAGTYLPRSLMGAAIGYTLGAWEELERYRDDGRLEIDNNLVENAIRPTALGKKNWLFIGHPEAGERSAIIYTLLENCRRLGINPQEYLHDVLTRLPAMTNHQVHTLTPAAWAASRRAKVA